MQVGLVLRPREGAWFVGIGLLKHSVLRHLGDAAEHHRALARALR